MTKLTSLLLLVICVLAFSGVLMAQNSMNCTTGTITGTYAYRYFGYFTAGPGPPPVLLPTASLGVATVDRGDISASWSQSFAGDIQQLGGTGKVKVNPDCTGSLEFTVNEGPENFTFHSEITILDNGKEILMMPVSPPGFVLTGELKLMTRNVKH